MTYIDYERDSIAAGLGLLAPVLHKHISFKHEKEFRALLVDTIDKFLKGKYKYMDGLFIQIDLNILIKNIFVMPTAPKWFFDLVKSILRRYGIKKPLKKSSL